MKKIKSILMIDDNKAEYRFNQIMIEEMNITDSIYIVENGKEALAFLSDKNNELPELILLDLYMPQMDGWEFLEEYSSLPLEHKTNIVLVVLSNSVNPDELKRAQHYKEANYFLVKPLTKNVITEIMERFF